MRSNFDAQSFRLKLSKEILKNPVDCIMLPEQRLLLVDEDLGLQLVSLRTGELEKNLAPSDMWRSPKAACLANNGKNLMVTMTSFTCLTYIYFDTVLRLPHSFIFQILVDFNINQRDGEMPNINTNLEVKKQNTDQSNELMSERRDSKSDMVDENSNKTQPKFMPYICRFMADTLEFIDRIEFPKYMHLY